MNNNDYCLHGKAMTFHKKERRISMNSFENQEKQYFDYLEEMKKEEDSSDFGIAFAY